MSMPESFEGRVVVGFDGSPVASHALDWAANYSAKRSLVVSIMTAVQLPAPAVGDGSWFDPASDILDEAAGRELKAGLEQLKGSHPDLTVEGFTVTDSPARVLIEASETAEVVVVGSRGRGEIAGLMLGSVSNAVAAHARGPVVVVPKTVPALTEGPIVVGVDAGDDGKVAFRFAMARAAEVGAPVTVVHAWGAMRSWTQSDAAHAELAAAVEKASYELLDHVVDEVSAEFPDVVVTKVSRHGSPSGTLVELSRNARLVVVGSRGRGGFKGLLLGSTSRGVLHGSQAPVAIITAPSDEGRR
ncbi:MAG: universal stress protein [Dermatophilus congolensis]|nr:universal stress protein [Dermatophilus congolensis]